MPCQVILATCNGTFVLGKSKFEGLMQPLCPSRNRVHHITLPLLFHWIYFFIPMGFFDHDLSATDSDTT